MEKLYQGEFSPKGLSPLPLAFVGDGVYELLVREHLLAQGNCPVKKLNSRKVELVRCQFQAQALEHILRPLPVKIAGAATPTWAMCPKTPTWRTTTAPRRWRPCSATCTWAGRCPACGSCSAW